MTRNTSSEDIVGLLKATGALQEGHFALSSGLHSGHYLQCALFLMYPENAALADPSGEGIAAETVASGLTRVG